MGGFNYEGALVPLKLAELLFLGRRGQWQHRRLLQLPCVAKPWEEKRGKKNKDTVKGILVRKTLHLSPLLILVLSNNEPALPYVNASANITLCTIFADWLWKEHLQYIILWKRDDLIFVATIEESIRHGAQEHFSPTHPFQDAACQRAPADGSFWTAVTRNRLFIQPTRRLKASELEPNTLGNFQD